MAMCCMETTAGYIIWGKSQLEGEKDVGTSDLFHTKTIRH